MLVIINKYLLNIYYAGATAVNKTDNFCSQEFIFKCEDQAIKNKHENVNIIDMRR